MSRPLHTLTAPDCKYSEYLRITYHDDSSISLSSIHSYRHYAAEASPIPMILAPIAVEGNGRYQGNCGVKYEENIINA